MFEGACVASDPDLDACSHMRVSDCESNDSVHTSFGSGDVGDCTPGMRQVR